MNWPLMRNNIGFEEVKAVAMFMESGVDGKLMWIGPIPRLTQGDQVSAFEGEFAAWLGCKYAVMVNSGSSANLITMAALKERVGLGEVIVPTICWSSDIMSVMHAGFTPVFVDIDPATLGMDIAQVFRKVTKNTKAVFVTHVLGFNAIHDDTRDRLAAMHIELIEDCCEATGATMNEKKLGTFGLASNFSFYYAHHITTVEGGMVCTDDLRFYNLCRLIRGHGLVREGVQAFRADIEEANEDLDPQFIFAVPGYNVRSTEINAVIGRSQLKRLDANIQRRTENLDRWLSNLDHERYVNDYMTLGSSNYALPLVLREPNKELMERVLACLEENGVEFRRGTAGGGNQLRQPYVQRLFYGHHEDYPQTEHVHFYGLYCGNYPDLEAAQLEELCRKLKSI